MKTTAVTVLLAVVLGLAVGVGSSAYRYSAKPIYDFSKPAAGVLKVKPSETGRPRIKVVGDDFHDFGAMSKDETRSHTFVVENVGDAPLEIRFLEKSCQCTDVSMTRSELLPNQRSEITLSWKPKAYTVDFDQVARFETNDPARLELDLTVKGEVQQIVRPIPPSLSFDRVRSNNGKQILFRLYGYRDENLQLTDVSFLNDENAEYFEADVSVVEEDVLATEPGAKSGVAVTLTLKPGLPIGPFYQRVRLNTNLADIEPVEIPIQGAVVGDIQVLGADYIRDTGVLSLGTLSASQEHERKLWLLVSDDDSNPVDLKVVETEPSGVLSASIGDPLKAGARKRIPISVRVKPDGRMINRLGNQQGSYGRILIETNREDAEQLVIKVSFLLEAGP